MTANGFLDEVFGPDPDAPSNPFEKCDTLSINNEKENDGVDFDNVFKWICRAGGRAKIEQKSDSYDLLVAFEEQQQNNIPGGFKITIAPLCGNKEAQTLGKELRFVDLQFIDLSVLYTVTVEELGTKYRRSRIIALPTKGMPDDRDKAIVNSIVSDKVKFAQYLSYLLDSDKLMAAIRTEHYSKEFVSKGSHHFSLTGNLYEKLLKVATDEPERLRELDKLMNMLDDNTIIEEFKQLYAVFKKALKIKQ